MTTKEIKKHSSRPVGGADTGSQAHVTRGNAAGSRDMEDCGTNRASSATASRPCGPTFVHR